MSHFLLQKFGWHNDEEDSVGRAAAAAREQSEIAREAESRRICAEAPAVVRDFERLLSDHGRRVFIYVAEYSAILKHSDADLRSGSIPSQITVHATASRRRSQEWWEKQRTDGNKAYALSAVVTSYDSNDSPIDTMWRIDVTTTAPVPPGNSDYMDVNVQREFVCEANSSSSSLQHEMLVLPLVHEEPALGLRISSIEAIGFSRENLMRVVERVDQDYYVPLEYQYSGLIARVHACCMMSNLRARCLTSRGTQPTWLQVETIPRAAFMLSRTSKRYVIAGNYLERAIEFIEQRLLRSNAEFDPTATSFTVRPFGPITWTAAWQAALDRRANVSSVAPEDSQAVRNVSVTVNVKVKIHFALLPPGGLLSIVPTPAPARWPATDLPEASMGVDDDGDEIKSYAPID
jgi:hypothetical protein